VIWKIVTPSICNFNFLDVFVVFCELVILFFGHLFWFRQQGVEVLFFKYMFGSLFGVVMEPFGNYEVPAIDDDT
jgi:hypothetical protein